MIQRPPRSTRPDTLFPYTTLLGEVEIHLRIGLAGQHRKADDILADFAHDIGKRHEVTGTLRHFHRLAVPPQTHHLHRSDERRVGYACVSPCRSRWSPTQ